MTPKSTSRLQVGTSGYSYAEWVTAGFYPPGTPSGRHADGLCAHVRRDRVELHLVPDAQGGRRGTDERPGARRFSVCCQADPHPDPRGGSAMVAPGRRPVTATALRPWCRRGQTGGGAGCSSRPVSTVPAATGATWRASRRSGRAAAWRWSFAMPPGRRTRCLPNWRRAASPW